VAVPSYAFFLVEQVGAVLVLRRNDLPLLANQWLLPGDALQLGETAEAACSRFARDELGIDLLGLESLADVTLEAGESATVFRVGFEGRLRYSSSGPIEDVAWASANTIPSPMPAEIRSLLERLFKGEL
jgi:ADP-ribose pyrophosphatase YjhB (NUDIX family)